MLIFLISCSKNEKPFKLFSQEAYAYDIGGAWELNATVRVKGFKEILEGSTHRVHLSYSLDFIDPSGRLIKNVYRGISDEKRAEDIPELGIETQINLNSSYRRGVYRLVYNIRDDYSGKTDTCSKRFELN